MKAELTGRMLAPTVERQHKFSRGEKKAGVAERREKREGGERRWRRSAGIFLV